VSGRHSHKGHREKVHLGTCTDRLLLRILASYMYLIMLRVSQNHICKVYIRFFWQGNHQIYGHIRCIYTVLANPNNAAMSNLG